MPGRYRGHDSRDNLFYTASGEVVYSSAGVGIVYNRKTHTQRFFLDHTDDIICVALHPDGKVVATGEIGKKAMIYVKLFVKEKWQHTDQMAMRLKKYNTHLLNVVTMRSTKVVE